MGERDTPRASWVTQVAGGRGAVRSLGCYDLRVERGADAGATVRVKQPRFRIGALHGNDLRLDDPGVSGHHCELTLEPEGFRLRDLGSKNGTFVGGCRVVEAFLPASCRLLLGSTELKFEVADETVERTASAADHFGPLLGQSLAMRELYEDLARIAPSDSTVLINGETGTGKELVAEALVAASPRAEAPLVVIDCSALAPTLVESELFGHEKGAFTGATSAQEGAFERAHGGTVLLDEVGELPLELQPKLLRALERREIRRLGGKAPLKVDVRVLAATHRTLETEVNQGRFRADLFYRLSVLRVTVPALRERAEDIPTLALHFARALGKEAALSPEALAELAAHSWPGNVRELRNAVERVVLGVAPFASNGPALPPSAEVDLEQSFLLQKERLVGDFERRYAQALVAWAEGNLAKAARKAGLTRMAVVKMLQRHGLPGR